MAISDLAECCKQFSEILLKFSFKVECFPEQKTNRSQYINCMKFILNRLPCQQCHCKGIKSVGRSFALFQHIINQTIVIKEDYLDKPKHFSHIIERLIYIYKILKCAVVYEHQSKGVCDIEFLVKNVICKQQTRIICLFWKIIKYGFGFGRVNTHAHTEQEEERERSTPPHWNLCFWNSATILTTSKDVIQSMLQRMHLFCVMNYVHASTTA